RAQGSHCRDRAAPGGLGTALRAGGGVAVGGGRPAPPVDGARHLPPPRHRRARLRAGPERELPGGDAGPRDGPHRRAGPVLPDRRRAGAGRAPRDRRPDRGRHLDHRGRQREPLRRPAPDRRRRRGLDGRHLGRSRL
ncbi:MAG: Xaa-Pro aminopeptidase, partial [uncultured Friedmanniella sp.]